MTDIKLDDAQIDVLLSDLFQCGFNVTAKQVQSLAREVKELRKGLAQRDAQIAALTAESVAMKRALNDILEPDAAVLERNHRVRALDAIETPATDAAVNEFMAQGVERFAERMRSFIGKPNKNDAAASYSSREAIMFAKQLREGK